MCPGNWTIQCALGMGQANVLCEWDFRMCPVNGTIQCDLGTGPANVLYEWDIQCAL